jgi:hypothetical protein
VWENVFSLLAIKTYWGMEFSCTYFKLDIILKMVNFISLGKEPSVPVRKPAVV